MNRLIPTCRMCISVCVSSDDKLCSSVAHLLISGLDLEDGGRDRLCNY